MNCRYHEKIERYHDGRLKEQENVAIENHLETCHICRKYLGELEYKDQFLLKIKSVNPELADPDKFRNEILSNVKPKMKWSFKYNLMNVFDPVLFVLLQPATRYSFISAAIIFFGIFVYQQSTIVQKIDSLEQRMETSINGRKTNISNRDHTEILSKYQEREKEGVDEIENLLDNYQLLQIKYRFLIRTLKDKYPETYDEIVRIIEEEKASLANVKTKKTL